jgi:hypothetical protein
MRTAATKTLSLEKMLVGEGIYERADGSVWVDAKQAAVGEPDPGPLPHREGGVGVWEKSQPGVRFGLVGSY